MLETYEIKFSAAGLVYVRQLLGQRPFDEVAALIMEIDGQRAHQDRVAAEPKREPAPAKDNVVALPNAPRPRRSGARPKKGNAAAPPKPPAPPLAS
jgi:hypothetical protein